jgi:hypothetical protein
MATEPTPDYPAAHSMDSCWFAVDRDGHIAYFDTGEAGAKPAESGHSHDLLALLARHTPRTEAIHQLEGYVLPGRGDEEGRHRTPWRDDQDTLGGMLLFLTSLEHVREAVERGEARACKASQGTAVIFQDLPADLSRKIHDAGHCLGCNWYWRWVFEDVEQDGPGRVSATDLGLFAYEHLCENWIAGPYGLQRRPAQPLHIDQLPPRLRAMVKQIRFDNLCFTETFHIQPCELMVCVAWGARYLASDGRTEKPLPGREAEFEEEGGYLPGESTEDGE